MNTHDAIAEKAVEWLVLQHSGEMTSAEREAFHDWRTAHPSHGDACALIEQMLGAMPQVAARPGLRQVMEKASERRQFLRKGLAATAFVSLAGLLYDQYSPLRGLAADLQTRTGERLSRPLRDGSRLSLDARSAVDLSVAPNMRRLSLLQGLIYVEVARGDVPFVIQTQDGLISLSEGRLTVDLHSQSTRVVQLSRSATLSLLDGQRSTLLAGQAGVMAYQRLQLQKAQGDRELSWLQGWVEIDNQPLIELIKRLRVYRTGIIRVEPEITQLRVSGVFPLDDTDRALETLEQTMPLSIVRRTAYWVSIGTKV